MATPNTGTDVKFFEGLPTEIHDHIFKQCNLVWEDDHKMPPLVIALRSQKKAYQNVLQFFFEENRLPILKINDWTLSPLSAGALLSVRKLKVEIGRSSNFLKINDTIDKSYKSTFIAHQVMEKVTERTPELQELDIIYNFKHKNFSTRALYNLLLEFPTWLSQIKNLGKVTVTVPICPENDEEFVPLCRDSIFIFTLLALELGYGDKTWRWVVQSNSRLMAWTAEGSELLDWSKAAKEFWELWNTSGAQENFHDVYDSPE